MDVRVLNPADASELWRLRQEALESEPDAFSSSAEEHRKLSVDVFSRRLGSEQEDSFVVGAFSGLGLTGMAGFYREEGPKTRHKGRVWGVYVTLPARGQGLGRALMRALIERARGMEGIEQIGLSVTTTQAAAARLYRSMGFASYAREPRALKVGGRYIDEEYMILYLKG